MVSGKTFKFLVLTQRQNDVAGLYDLGGILLYGS